MKRNNFLKHILLACAVLVAFSACRKVPEGDLSNENPTAGTSYIGFPTGMEKATFFDPFTNVKSVNVFTIKKDAANSAELQKSQSIVLTALPNAIEDYNTAHGKTYELLPASYYTIGGTDKGISQGANGDLTFAFAGGDFSKDFVIKLDGSKLDLSKSYALAYQISSTDGLAIHAASKDTLYAFFSVKNKWDGVYEFTGTMVDVTNAGLTHVNNYLEAHGEADGTPAPMQYELRTISATECAVYDNYYYGGNYMLITNGDAMSNYGSFALIVKFDPATNKVVEVRNFYGQPASNTRSAQLDPSGANQYDPGSKTVSIKYRMLQPSVVTEAPYIRTTWEETWKYIGSR